MTTIGTNRLGRKYVPDDRDWTSDKLHEHLEPPPELLDETVGDAIASSPFFQTWTGILLLWRWIKSLGHRKPTPADTTPSWVPGAVLDQGEFGTCVGNGWAGWGNSTPVVDLFNETDARSIYYEATVIDGQPDRPTDPPDFTGGQQGTSVRSGAKAMQNRKRLAAYGFAANLTEIDEWVNHHGPVVMGTNWYTGMFSPDSQGLVLLTGQIEGGHCYIILDRLDGEGVYLCRNSWGKSWGQDGNFKVKVTDMARLLSEQGDACLAAEL